MRYLVNKSTKEIHDRHLERPACQIEKMLEDSSNVLFVDLKEMKRLIREDFDLCDKCFADDPKGV